MSSRWPFLIPLLFMTAGLSLAVIGGFYSGLTTVLAVFACMLLACFLPYSGLFSVLSALFFFLWVLFALQPWLFPDQSRYSIRNKASDTPATIEGVISSRPSVAPEGSRLTVRVEHVFSGGRAEAATGVLLLYVSK